VFVGLASDGFAATARAVAFESPLATALLLFVLFATAALVGVRPVPETAVAEFTTGVVVAATDGVTVPLLVTAAVDAASVKIAPSPSAPLVTIGVPLELFDEFAVCCGFAYSAGEITAPVVAPAFGSCCVPDGEIGPSTRPR
jgi:hypothetical protein